MLSVTTPDLLDSPGEAADARRLPFAFAKRHGVLLIATANGVHLAYRPGTSVTALAEAQRFAGQVQEIVPLELEAFDQALSDAYQHNSRRRCRWSRAWAMSWIWRAWPSDCRKPKT